jgi:hypothetical protein
MSSQKIITGITVTEQMTKAKDILNKQILPKEALFQERKRKGQLSKELLNALNANALLDNHRRM